MTLREAFFTILFLERGTLTAIGVDRRRAANIRTRILAANKWKHYTEAQNLHDKKGFPLDKTMRELLEKAGWRQKPEEWTKE